MKINKSNFIFLVIVAISVISYTLAFFVFQLPFFMASFDSYCHAAMIKSLDCYSENNCDLNVFPDSYVKDVHIGQNIASYFITELISGVHTKTFFYIFGIVNIFLLLFALKLFSEAYLEPGKVTNIFLILVLVFTSSFIWVGSSFSSLLDLNYVAHYPKILGLGIMVLMLALNKKYEKEPKIIYLQALLFTILITSHVLTAIFFGLFILASLILTYRNKLLFKRYVLLLGVLIATAFILSFTWPFHNVILESLKAFSNFQSGEIASGGVTMFNFSFFVSSTQLFLTLPLLFISIYQLVKDKKYYFLVAIGLLLFISFSYTIPYLPKVNGYWRFTVLLIPLFMGGFALYLKEGKSPKWFKLLAIFFMVVLLILSGVTTSINRSFAYRGDIDDLSSLTYPADGRVLLVSPEDSCFIQSETDLKVLNAEQGHVSDPEKVLLNDQLNNAVALAISRGDTKGFLEILKGNDVDYILVRQSSDTSDFFRNLALPEVASKNKLTIYGVR